MAYVDSLHYYPLSGARPISPENFDVSAAGAVHDRLFVLYNSRINARDGENRVSQKQIRQLAQVSITPEVVFDEQVFSITAPGIDTLLLTDFDGEPDTQVNEFGDIVPAFDTGSARLYLDPIVSAYEESNDLVGNIRLAQKHPLWFFVGFEEAKNRTVAPLHIVTSSSVEALQRLAKTSSFGAERFRPNIVVDTEGSVPFIENDWIGRTIYVGGVPVLLTRPTKRCPVPGYDQVTGENKKDIPKLYPGLEHVDGKPIFGVYGYPILDAGDVAEINIGDSIYLDAT